MGKFHVYMTKNEEYTFKLTAANGEIIMTASESYSGKDACLAGIESVRKNALAQVEDQTAGETKTHPKYELYADKAGEFRFRLKAANGQIIGKSEGYVRKDSALNGVASIGKNAPDAEVVVEA